MENFDRENIDELLEIRQIRQYFPPSKICAIRYNRQVGGAYEELLLTVPLIGG